MDRQCRSCTVCGGIDTVSDTYQMEGEYGPPSVCEKCLRDTDGRRYLRKPSSDIYIHPVNGDWYEGCGAIAPPVPLDNVRTLTALGPYEQHPNGVPSYIELVHAGVSVAVLSVGEVVSMYNMLDGMGAIDHTVKAPRSDDDFPL